MSVKVTNWVWHDDRTQHLRGNAVVVMLALADIADDEGRVVFVRDSARTQVALAAKARVSVATFRRQTQDLEADGLLVVDRESQTSVNEYQILLTAQSERSVVSGQIVGFERSDRSPVSGHTSLLRTDVNTDVSEVADAPIRGDVERLLDLLDEEIERNGGRRPTRSKKNIDAARLLLDRDGKTVEQVEAAIRWCQSDEFWRANVLSMSKLREKYETLRLQAARSGRVGAVEAGREADAMLAARERMAVGA